MPTDALRRRQFRALKTAVMVGLIFAALVALVLYLIYSQRGLSHLSARPAVVPVAHLNPHDATRLF